MKGPQRTPPNLELPPDLESIYTNVARISHSPAELIMDFARLLPGQSPAKVLTRLIMSPVGAKLFYRILGENLARYEANYGEIQLPGDSGLAQQLFRSTQPPDPPSDPENKPEEE